MKISIIGAAGTLGSCIAFDIIIHKLADEIVMIDPKTGKIKARADMRGLLKPEDRNAHIDVLNGIAWDETDKRLFVTGKNWPKIYRIELIEK